MRVVGVVLAAGASSRFGSPKLLAALDGRPVLQHVLDTLAAGGPRDVVVVLGSDSAAIEARVRWRSERRVVNPRPGDGLSSSLRIGLDAAAEDPAADAVLIVLGDQPFLRPDAVEAVLAMAGSTDRPIVRARYPDDDAPNPVLVRRAAWTLAAGISGDRGLGPLLAEHPGLVAEAPAAGRNPDVDTPDDLARLSGVSWPR
jgi:molybdenum cofactor cytidylyltransferase